MSKCLEALERLYCAGNLTLDYVCSNKHKEDYSIIEKELKAYEESKEQLPIINKYIRALEIIKDICELKVYKNKLGQCFLEGTNILFPISQETYDLLKEVLL